MGRFDELEIGFRLVEEGLDSLHTYNIDTLGTLMSSC